MSSHWIQSFICFILIDLQTLTMKFRNEGKALNIFIILNIFQLKLNTNQFFIDKE